MTAPMMFGQRGRPRGLPDAPGGDYAQAFTDATNAQGAMAREDFQQDQGHVLGGLQAIGALRSGRANTELDNLSRTYGRQVGNIAAGNAGQLASLDASMQQQNANRQENAREYDTSQAFNVNRAARSDFTGDRQFGVDQANNARDFAYQGQRDTRADTVNDRNFGYQQSQDTRAQGNADRIFGYQQSRDAVGDANTNRQFGEDQRRYDQGFGYQQSQDTRAQGNADRQFGESQREFNVGSHQFDLTRDDARNAARQQGQASLWGAALGGAAQLGSAYLGNRNGGGGGRSDVTTGNGTADKISNIAGAAGSAWNGFKSGGTIGASIGSIVPGVGTAIGGAIGGVLGGAYGGLKKLFHWGG